MEVNAEHSKKEIEGVRAVKISTRLEEKSLLVSRGNNKNRTKLGPFSRDTAKCVAVSFGTLRAEAFWQDFDFFFLQLRFISVPFLLALSY